jgi:hypothetical protein
MSDGSNGKIDLEPYLMNTGLNIAAIAATDLIQNKGKSNPNKNPADFSYNTLKNMSTKEIWNQSLQEFGWNFGMNFSSKPGQQFVNDSWREERRNDDNGGYYPNSPYQYTPYKPSNQINNENKRNNNDNYKIWSLSLSLNKL